MGTWTPKVCKTMGLGCLEGTCHNFTSFGVQVGRKSCEAINPHPFVPRHIVKTRTAALPPAQRQPRHHQNNTNNDNNDDSNTASNNLHLTIV